MIRNKLGLTIVLLFPILALLALTVYKKYILMTGYEATLPITGYDPRSLLSGHYLIYRIEYGAANICSGTTYNQKGFICLAQKKFSLEEPQQCKLYIRGICRYGQFYAGIEQFYIPEAKANLLEKQIQSKNASIIISVLPNGHAEVKELLINGKPWE